MGIGGFIKSVGRKAVTDYNPVAGVAKGAYHAARGDWGKAGGAMLKGGLGGATGGLGAAFIDEGAGALASGFGAVKDWYNRPYDEAKSAMDKAGADAEALGTETRDFYLGGLDRAQGEFGQAQDVYRNTVGRQAPGQFEQFAEQAAQGKNRFYDHARQDGARSLDSAFAARGMANSGAALEAQAKMNAELGAQQGRDMSDLLAQGQRFGMERDRSAFDGARGLAGDRAGLVSGFYGQAGDAYQQGKLARINSQLGKARLGIEKRKDDMSLIGTGLGVASGFLGVPGMG